MENTIGSGSRWMTEAQLQNKCTLWFWNTFHSERRMLHHNDNNSINSIEGSRKKALGVVSGVSDLELILIGGKIVFIELKLPGETQLPEQIDFEAKVKSRGHIYIIIYSFVEFQNFIQDICNIGK